MIIKNLPKAEGGDTRVCGLPPPFLHRGSAAAGEPPEAYGTVVRSLQGRGRGDGGERL